MPSLTRWPFALRFIVAILLTTAAGLAHGLAGHRWGPSGKAWAAARQLEGLPAEIGEWQVDQLLTLPQVVSDTLQCTGYVYRTYVNRRTREMVTVALFVGPHGPIAVHQPEICYSASDYRAQSDRQEFVLPGKGKERDSLWQLALVPTSVGGPPMRVYYGWSTGGHWDATELPRVKYWNKPYLYKIQLASPASASGDAEDVGQRFLRDFVPAARPFLVES